MQQIVKIPCFSPIREESSASENRLSQAGVFLAALLLSAALVRLILGYTAVHYFDLGYYVDWSSGVLEDFFGAYDRIENLDYPPLFLFPLYFTGWVMSDPRV